MVSTFPSAIQSRNRRVPEIILIDISVPPTFDYFMLEDVNGETWFYWADPGGALMIGRSAPTDTDGRGLRPNLVSPVDLRHYIEITGGSGPGPNRWLRPDTIDGQLLVESIEPAGTAWVLGTEIVLYTMAPGQQVGISVDQFDTLSHDTPATPLPARDDQHARFSSGPISTLYDGVLWDARVIEGYDLSGRIGDITPFEGRMRSGIGRIRLARGQSGIPVLDEIECMGCAISIREGGTRGRLLQRGEVLRVERSYQELTIQTADGGRRLQQQIQENRYEAGTGAFNAGLVIPLCFGYVQNITPALVEPEANMNIYQVHDGIIGGVPSVREGGIELPYRGDIRSLGLSSLQAWRPGATPGYATDNAGGMFRVSPQPQQTLTCDVLGDARQGGPTTTSGIIGLIASEYGNYNLDQGSFARVDDNAAVGIYVNVETSLEQVLLDLVRPMQSYFGFSPAGLFIYGQVAFREPVETVESWQLTEPVRPVGLEVPPWQVQVEWGINYTQQDENQLRLGATTGTRQFVRERARVAEANNVPIRQQFPTAATLNVGGFFQHEADAEEQARRVMVLRSHVRRGYELKYGGSLRQPRPGDTIFVNAGNECRVQDYIVVAASYQTDTRVTTLRIWG